MWRPVRRSRPFLDGDLPDHSTLLDSEQRAAAGVAWTGWWQAVVARDIRLHQGSPDGLDQRAWMQEQAVEHRAVFDPPEFASFAEQPGLREALGATFEGAAPMGWRAAPGPAGPPSGPSQPVRLRHDPNGGRGSRTPAPDQPGRGARLRRGTTRQGKLVATVRARRCPVLGARRPRAGHGPHHAQRRFRVRSSQLTATPASRSLSVPRGVWVAATSVRFLI